MAAFPAAALLDRTSAFERTVFGVGKFEDGVCYRRFLHLPRPAGDVGLSPSSVPRVTVVRIEQPRGE